MGQFFKTKVIPVFQLTFEKWQKDGCADMAASLSYYALFSLFPLLLLILSVFGLVLGNNLDVRTQILDLSRESLPAEAFQIVDSTLNNLSAQGRGAGLIGLVVLLVSASGFFGALDRVFDKIWEVKPEAPADAGLLAKALFAIQQQSVSFLLVLGCALLVIVSTISGFVIDILLTFANSLTQYIGVNLSEQAWLLQLIQIGVSFLLMWLVLLLLFKFLPSLRVRWRDVWLGALLSAVAFIALQRIVVGGIVNLGSNYQSYGVIGGVMLLMFWIYLSSQVLLFGAEFSFAYTHLFGSRQAQPAPVAAAPAPPVQRNLAPPPPVALPDANRQAAAAAGIGVLLGVLGTVVVSIGALIVGITRMIKGLWRAP